MKSKSVLFYPPQPHHVYKLFSLGEKTQQDEGCIISLDRMFTKIRLVSLLCASGYLAKRSQLALNS